MSATINGNTATYAYDGEGLRVSKTVGGQTTIYVYDAFGNLAAEYGTPTASPCGTTTCYLTTDHLGSTRLLTDNVGSSTNVKRYDFLPFGEEIVAPINGRSTSMGYPSSPDAFLEKFTGHARDTETANINSMTGLDWMRARYYSSSQGRFQSVDPANAGASVGDPQSWNGYSYVGNNPLTYTDPDGRDPSGMSAFCGLGGVWGCVAGAAVNLCRMFCGDLFGGQPSPAAPKVMAGGGIGNSPEVWSERAPTGGGVNTGGTYGTGCGTNGICSFNPKTHYAMTKQAALGAGLTDLLADLLAKRVVNVDIGTQGTQPEMTHIHGMGGLKSNGQFETCAEAYAGAIRGLQTDIAGARGSGIGAAAAQARALHVIQDSYSSSHRYQKWIGGNLGLATHGTGDLGWSDDAVLASRSLLRGLSGAEPLKAAEAYLYRPANCR